MHEASQHHESSFVTLTYDDEHLPKYGSLSSDSTNGDTWQQPKDKHHVSKFIKRLRHETPNLRYYLVGEYGDKSNRAHYHACIFGHAFTKDRVLIRTQPSWLWTSKRLTEVWGLGMVSVGALTFTTAQYVTNYVTKKLTADRRYVRTDTTTGELINLVQPKAYMSRRPAIGRTWLDSYGDRVYDHDHVVINGKPSKPPKYYDRWRGEEKMKKVKEKRRKEAKKLTAEQNHARAQNAHARAKIKTSSI